MDTRGSDLGRVDRYGLYDRIQTLMLLNHSNGPWNQLSRCSILAVQRYTKPFYQYAVPNLSRGSQERIGGDKHLKAMS